MNERIKELREQLGLNQEDFGDKIGLTKSGISNIESGRRTVSERHIKLLCAAFGVNEEWLRNGSGKMFETLSDEAYLTRIAKNNSLDPLIMGIVKTYVELSSENKQVLVDFISSVADKVQGAESDNSEDSLYNRLKSQIPKDEGDSGSDGETNAS